MLNSELIRISTLAKIVLPGHILRVTSEDKAVEGWTNLCDSFISELKTHIQDEKTRDFVKIIQRNETNKLNLQVPDCPEFSKLSSLMYFSQEFAEKHQSARLSCVASRTNLEQTFLAYASHQKQRDTTANNPAQRP